MSPVPTISLVLRQASEKNRERSAALAVGAELLFADDLQEGLRAATGEVAIFLRAECLPLPGWLAHYRRAFADPTLAAAAGRVFPTLAPEAPDWARVVSLQNFGPFERFDLGHFDRTVQAQDRYFRPTDNFALRRSTAIQFGGIDPDRSLLLRLLEKEAKVHYLPGATVRRPIPATYPLDECFGPWWEEHGRRQVRLFGPHEGFARFKARLKAWRKSLRYRKRMGKVPAYGAAWTTLAAKFHLHRGRARELGS